MKGKYIITNILREKRTIELDLPRAMKNCSDNEIKAAISRASKGSIVESEVIMIQTKK